MTISVSNPTLVGSTVLEAGDYRFQCKRQTLSDKNGASELRSLVRPDGTRVLQSVRIKGETIAHRLIE